MGRRCFCNIFVWVYCSKKVSPAGRPIWCHLGGFGRFGLLRFRTVGSLPRFGSRAVRFRFRGSVQFGGHPVTFIFTAKMSISGQSFSILGGVPYKYTYVYIMCVCIYGVSFWFVLCFCRGRRGLCLLVEGEFSHVSQPV